MVSNATIFIGPENVFSASNCISLIIMSMKYFFLSHKDFDDLFGIADHVFAGYTTADMFYQCYNAICIIFMKALTFRHFFRNVVKVLLSHVGHV